jgi:hypothetical protein
LCQEFFAPVAAELEGRGLGLDLPGGAYRGFADEVYGYLEAFVKPAQVFIPANALAQGLRLLGGQFPKQKGREVGLLFLGRVLWRFKIHGTIPFLANSVAMAFKA